MKVMGRWATLGFTVFAFVLGALIAVVAVRLMIPGTRNLDLYGRIANGTRLAVISLASSPVMIITLMLASRRSGSSVFAYLGLDIPGRRHIVITVAGLAVWIAFTAIIDLVLGRDADPWILAIHRSAQADGSLIWLWLAIVIAAPISEEVLFRGFMFRGFVRAPRDAVPSIVLISLIWSLQHIQYDLLDITEIFVLGLLLGLVRWRTGSTTLTILLHAINNLVGLILVEFEPAAWQRAIACPYLPGSGHGC
jgi:uncharacterized protein